MAAEPSATTPAMIVARATDKDPLAAENPAADPVRWEYRLTADRRRILVAVNRTANLEGE